MCLPGACCLQWSSQARVHLQSALCPHFAHATTVGLYESLLGIRRLSTVTADSVLHCFFIDRQRILAASQSSNAVADFIWKVCQDAHLLSPQPPYAGLSSHTLLTLQPPDWSRLVAQSLLGLLRDCSCPSLALCYPLFMHPSQPALSAILRAYTARLLMCTHVASFAPGKGVLTLQGPICASGAPLLARGSLLLPTVMTLAWC